MTWLAHFLMRARAGTFMRWLVGTKTAAAPSARGSTTVITVVKTLRGSALYGASVGEWIGWHGVKL